MLDHEYEEELPFLPASHYCFYKIICKDPDIKKCYIGKTKNLKDRIAQHKCKSVTSDINLYQVIRKHGGWSNWELTMHYKCICDEKASIYIEVAIMKQFKDNGYDLLNCQLPTVDYPNQQYNKSKCKEHYAIKKECECGWLGSKMEWAHHRKSKRHRRYCLEKYQDQICLELQNY